MPFTIDGCDTPGRELRQLREENRKLKGLAYSKTTLTLDRKLERRPVIPFF
ncbi:MAG TPA: hypothetical protein VKM54_12510 [Myxococcota bacterium]|nr:hypothetical protein [Myxococcota bacterium]